MKNTYKLLAAAGLLALSIAPASAVVRYEFTAFSSFDFSGEQVTSGGFVLELPDFVTSFTSVPLANLISCSVATTAEPVGGLCRQQDFLFGISPDTVTVSFGINTALNPGTGIFYYFADTAFAAPGTYDTVLFGKDQAGQLVVTDLSGAVPEPATWAMMLAGFGAIGFAMRNQNARRRRKVAVSFA